MDPVSRRTRGANQWTEGERNRLWQLRQQHLDLGWKDFNNHFFPHRSYMAVVKAYSDMKIEKGMGRSKHMSKVKTKENQRKRKNTHKPSGKSTTEQEQQPKIQHTTLPVSGGSRRPSSSSPNGGSRAEEPESDSDTASDSDAGDIPFDNGIPEKLPSRRPPGRPRRQPVPTALAQQKTQSTNDSSADSDKTKTKVNSKIHPKKKKTTVGLIQAQSPPPDYIRATFPVPMTPSNQTSEACSSSTNSHDNAATTMQQSGTTQNSGQHTAEATPKSLDESCASLYQTFHQVAAILAQYPQAKAEAKLAKQENTEKEDYVREMQSSHAAEISYRRNLLAAQNELVQEQSARIEDFQKRLQTIEDQKRSPPVLERFYKVFDGQN